jgi:gamma-glutamylcyclotransferase (GGCT)/AIG2-like uncharacterized protein YtfP
MKPGENRNILKHQHKMINNQRHYAFYGSLRKGMENFYPYKNSLNFLETIELKGYRMYSLADYPYAVRTGDNEDKIIADLFTIKDAATEQSIHKMEIEAGYIFANVTIGNIKFGIYLFEKAGGGDPEVKDGDWSNFRKVTGF